MALITRVSRLFKADFHAVLDRIEEPDLLLRQAVREMEDALARDEQRLKVLRHELGQITNRQTDLDRSVEKIGEELDICFESEKEDLARGLVKRKLEAERLGGVLARKRAAVEQSIADLEARQRDNRSRLEDMRQKAELLAEDDTSEETGEPWSMPDGAVRDEDVEVAFLREKQKRSRS